VTHILALQSTSCLSQTDAVCEAVHTTVRTSVDQSLSLPQRRSTLYNDSRRLPLTQRRSTTVTCL